MGGIGDDVWFVFERNVGVARVRDHDAGVLVPGLAAVERAPDENAIAGGTVRPVIFRTQFVERDVAEKGVSLVVVGDRDIARNFVVSGSGAFREGPGLAGVARVGEGGIDLKGAHKLARIARVDRDGRLGEVSGLGRQLRDPCARWSWEVGRCGRNLRKRGDSEQAKK